VRHPQLLALFGRHVDSKGKQAKLKSPNQLQELLDISRSVLQVRLVWRWLGLWKLAFILVAPACVERGLEKLRQPQPHHTCTAAAHAPLLHACTHQELEHAPPPGLSEEEVEAREETREKLRIVKTVLEQVLKSGVDQSTLQSITPVLTDARC
jgi:hypothetical protein